MVAASASTNRLNNTNLENGVTNVGTNDPLGAMPQLDDSKLHFYFNDFDTYQATDWIVTKIGTGTQALAALAGGVLLTTNTAAAPDSISNQLNFATFQLQAGKQAWFKIRLKISDATTSTLQVGLQATDSTPFTFTDGIVFTKAAATAAVTMKVVNTSTATTSATVATLANDTFIVLAWYYDGINTVTAYADGVRQTSTVATNLPSALMNLSFAMGNGSAAARNYTIDYVFAATER